MLSFNDLMFIFEIFGCASFAISGVMVAKHRRMDIFGAVILGCATAVGGGMIRDLILGQTPPAMFTNRIYVETAFFVSVADFIFEKLRAGRLLKKIANVEMAHMMARARRIDTLITATDSVGLAVFVVVGTRAAFEAGYPHNGFLCVFVGVLTGIGGGILRDVLAGQMPLIMRKRVYGVAAIIGAAVYYKVVSGGADGMSASAVSILATVLVRYLAIHYNWNLPAL